MTTTTDSVRTPPVASDTAHLPRRTRLGGLGRAALKSVVLASCAASLLLAVPAPAAQALAKIKCHETVGFAKLDPIVYHAQTGNAHLHQFYGNTAWLAKGNWANYSDLAGGATNCRDKADTAGYWTPALFDAAGKPVPVQAFTAYYRPYEGIGTKFGAAMAYPPDTRLVATDDHRGGWSCGQNSGARSVLKQAIPDCSGLSGGPGLTLTAHVQFPSCWNGKLPNHTPGEVGNTSDNADYAYPVRVNGAWTCPTAFPKKMVTLTETIQYTYTGKGTDLKLSSDSHAGTNDGQSMHADFWNTWNQAGLVNMVKNCVLPGGSYTTSLCAI